MNTHEIAQVLLDRPAADLHLFGGYTGEENEQTILLPWRIEFSTDGSKAVIVPDLPEIEEETPDLEEATKRQGERPPIDEEVVQRLFSEFEIQRVSALYAEWEKEKSPDKPAFAALVHEEIVTEEKIEEINKDTNMPNDRKFWAYVLEAYVLNVLQKDAQA